MIQQRHDERKHARENKRRPSCFSLVNDLDRSLAEITKTYDLALLVVLYIGVLECGEGVARVGGRGRANRTEVLLFIVGC
jgi:hypothetical protein